jgi:CheY-like chemotaxis protein
MTTILLVEDDTMLIEILASVLQEQGYSVQQAFSAEEALRFCETSTPDVIVSDVKMGEMDGFTFFEEVHRMARLKNIPFLFITAFDDYTGVAKAKELGAAGYITKPFDLDNVLQTIQSLVSPP